MPPERMVCTPEEALIEELFHNEYQKLVCYATVILDKYGAKYVSASGRAEDVVQELFCLAWEKQDEMMKSESPTGWLYKALTLKVREALREDRKWAKRLALIPHVSEIDEGRELSEVWTQLLLMEDFDLLRKRYVEGYSYKELCAELGLKKSALAMRISRSKEKAQRIFEDFEI